MIAPNLKVLELNGVDKLTDFGLNTLVKYLIKLETVLINLTPNVDQKTIDELVAKNPGIHIVRHTVKMSDPTDDGLRIPRRPLAEIIKGGKKKKKKKK